MERHQISIYFGAILAAVAVSSLIPGGIAMEGVINPALALMLFVTFLQVPLAELQHALTHGRFLAALLLGNFVFVPLLVAAMLPFLPIDPLIQLGALMVLLTPCIDYVVTFAYLGRADARLLLAATPALLIVQMALLPLYLQFFLGGSAADIVQWRPFLEAFAWLIAGPLLLAALLQSAARRGRLAARYMRGLGHLPVPATAAVLFIIVATVMPQLNAAGHAALQVIPLYVAFAVVAPGLGWFAGRLFSLEPRAGRAVAFSTGTRNSLVILPLALAVPGAMPILPAVIVTQTIVELLSELAFIHLIPRLGRKNVS